MVLAAAGVLDDRPAITHHGVIDELREYGANVTDARVVDDGDVLTAGGVTAGIDLALHLVERIVGAELTERVAWEMEHERSEDIHRSDRD
jgi:transcriptional regulator GlxA family with amidase domain